MTPDNFLKSSHIASPTALSDAVPAKQSLAEESSNGAGVDEISDKQNFMINPEAPVVSHGITTFVADESTKVATIPERQDILETFKSSLRINNNQDIVDFLNRPTLIADGGFNTTDTVSTFPYYFLPDVLLSSAMFAPKIQGFLGIRGTYVITLQINANRFTQGRYLLNFYPSGGAINAAQTQYFRAFHNFSLVQRTTVPGIQIDLNTETQVTLKIPFCIPYLYNNIRSATTASNFRQFGTIQISPYVPTTNACSYALWGHIEGAELFIPTVPQARSRMDQEQKSKNIGPVEGIATAVSKSTEHFRNVPILGDFVTPVKWASDIVSSIASAFGWSKPTISDTIQVFGRHRGFQNVNVDGADLAVKMSLSVKNEVATIPGLTGTDIDEMSFDYIKTIPAWYSTVAWSNQAREANLATLNLNPSSFGVNLTDNGNAVVSLTPCAMPIHNFSLYRGGFKLKIKLVKTEFHSGRLAVVFVPQATNGLAPPGMTYASSYFTNRHIIDIRYGTEWDFEFPFVSEFTYLSNSQAYGQVFIYVENPLNFPASVSGTVQLLFEVSGLPDLEYAMPTQSNIYAYHPTAPQAAGQFNSYKFDEAIGDTKPKSLNLDYAKASIGEKFTSIRQLIKRMELWGRNTGIVNNLVTSVFPHALKVVEGVGTAGTPSFPTYQPDSIDYFSLMFAVSRGGMRIKLYDPTPLGQGSCYVYTYVPNLPTTNSWAQTTTVDYNLNNSPATSVGGMAAQVPISDGLTAEVQVPMYSRALGYATADVLISGDRSSSVYQINNAPTPIRALSITQMTLAANSPRAPFILRGASDDFSLHGFIAVPPTLTVATDPYVANGWN